MFQQIKLILDGSVTSERTILGIKGCELWQNACGKVHYMR